MHQTVITYREAHRNAKHDLCAACAADGAADLRERNDIGPLGPVEYGAHDGLCEVCGYAKDRD